ncbi:phosphoribosyltransferase [Streptomyces omiyaensis]|uniref:phosphoribosyltransferase n=1 Tax=Streptomyces omiyaensis TaxID=68247 RepID=UPI0036FE1038
MARFIWPIFSPDSRANRITDYTVTRLGGGVTADRWLYLLGPEEAAEQVRMTGLCMEIAVPEARSRTFTHAFRFHESNTNALRSMCNLLKEALSLTTKPDLDCAIAFDWYKIPPENNSPKWPNTPTGELIYRGKYYSSGMERTTARRELAAKYVQILNEHPLYRECTQIVTIPGHKADGNSFGEQLATTVAEKSGKELIPTQSPGGPRPQAKEGPSQVGAEHFAMPKALTGDVIIIDDVYRSGTTMSAVAKTAKMAGANRTLGLAAVRTMRN